MVSRGLYEEAAHDGLGESDLEVLDEVLEVGLVAEIVASWEKSIYVDSRSQD